MSANFRVPGITLKGTLKTPPPLGLRAKIKALEDRMSNAEAVLARHQGEFERESRARAAALEDERRARADEIRELRQDMVKASVADPWKTMFGIVCLFVGVLLSGTATSIVALRDRLG